jgi:hypothetical protein
VKAFFGKVLGPWLVSAPQDGPGMKRYAETPGITPEERRSIEPWNYPQPAPAHSRWGDGAAAQRSGQGQSQ